MEVRHIKTCHGLQEVRFLDGALVPVDVDLGAVVSIALIQWSEIIQTWDVSELQRMFPAFSFLAG